MFSFFKAIKSLFVADMSKKIKKMIDQKYKESVSLQRNGKLREYGKIMKEIEELEEAYARATEDESR